jgi:hypothetical protein
MKKITIYLLLLLILIIPTTLLAQEESQEEDLVTTTQYFDIKMERLNQSAWNKAVTYIIYVTPKVDSPRTQILWDAPSAISIKTLHKEFVNLYKGQNYTFKARVKPNKAGTYELAVNLIAWQYDANYSNSVTDIISFNSELLAQPVKSSYTVSLIVKYLTILLIIAGVIYGIYFYAKRGLKITKRWLTPPD